MILIAHPQATSTDHSGFRTSNLSIEKLDVTTSLPLLLIRFPIFKAEDGKKTKFDPRLQDGCVLPKEYMPYPPELLNTPLEDMDEVRRQLGKVRALIWLQTKVRTDKNNYKNFWYFEIFFTWNGYFFSEFVPQSCLKHRNCTKVLSKRKTDFFNYSCLFELFTTI